MDLEAVLIGIHLANAVLDRLASLPPAAPGIG